MSASFEETEPRSRASSRLCPDQLNCFLLYCLVACVQMEPKQNPCPPHKIRHQDGFRRPVRLAGADGAPLRQLRASRAWRCKAQSRSRPGRPWRFCPDRLHPFLLYCLVESVPLEPNQNPCLLASVQMVPKQSPYPPHKIRHQDDFRQPIRLAGADGAPLRQLRASRALRSKAQSRSRRGGPRCFFSDWISPFLLHPVVESVQMEPNQNPCPPQPDSAQLLPHSPPRLPSAHPFGRS